MIDGAWGIQGYSPEPTSSAAPKGWYQVAALSPALDLAGRDFRPCSGNVCGQISISVARPSLFHDEPILHEPRTLYQGLQEPPCRCLVPTPSVRSSEGLIERMLR